MKLSINSAFTIQTLQEQIDAAKIIAEADSACDQLRDNAWRQMVASVVKSGSVESAKAYFKEYETAYKAATDAKKMPGWYRSNKSVAGRALERNVEMLNGDGYPRGKTELEKELAGDNEPKTPIERITKAFGTIRTNMEHDDFEADTDLAAVRKLAEGLLAHIHTLTKE